jgi:hypothetical protein
MPAMALVDVLGALLTLIGLGVLLLGGFLAAVRLLGKRAEREPLTLAIASLVATSAIAVGIGLALGAVGLLRIDLALAGAATLVLVLAWGERRAGSERTVRAADALARGAWRRLRQYPALTLIAAFGAGTELLRGLLRPPLSWDSLMYHLFLAATWLQRGGFGLVAARSPTTAYFFIPADGSVWLWWWMAPSHSEIYVNLAYVPAWLLLGLAAGGIARRLGARRHWPIAAFSIVLTPTVLRFLATQYVDILLGAALAAATYFALCWLERPSWTDAVLAGAGAGLALGSKVLGLPFAAALAGMVVLLLRRPVAKRLAQIAAALALALLLGGYFYARNVRLGGGLFAFACTQQQAPQEGGLLANFPSRDSLVGRLGPILEHHELSDAFLGSLHPTLAELGVGPQVVLLLIVLAFLPFAGWPDRRAAWLILGQVAAQAVVWATIPYTPNAHILADVRYLIGALALLFAAATALGERRLPEGWLRWTAVAVAVQDLLMLRAAMPRQVRVALALGLLAAVVLGASSRLRRGLARRWLPVTAVAAVAALASVPALVSYRVADRERAFAEEYTAHLTSSRLFAHGWGWLDRHAGSGTVAVSHAPKNYFVYPAMGPFLERRAVYVPVNREAYTNPLRYPECDTRIARSPDAWLENLRREDVRWLYVARFPELDFPVEDRWARDRPRLFRLRFEDSTNRVYEVLGAGTSPAASSSAALRRSNR